MSLIERILIGLALIALGGMMVWKTPWALEMVGRVDFAERWFGGGGTRIFFKLLGTAIIIIGFIFITNLFEYIIGGFLLRIFG